MRKTKILVTLGPSTEQEPVLRELINAGMNVARLNFSHGDYEEHGARVATVKKLREEMKKPVALMLDTKGPEIRTGMIEGDKIHLEAGKSITLTTTTVTGTADLLSISFDRLPSMLESGS
ncbi:MAG TPA: pyruvate kinase, partial [Candidatus Rifleibacterium sp.]|nr:pyruvate kinase [Candidatus Rifleibacterium sp.]